MLGNLSSPGKFKQAQVSDKDPRQTRNVTFERTLCEKFYIEVYERYMKIKLKFCSAE